MTLCRWVRCCRRFEGPCVRNVWNKATNDPILHPRTLESLPTTSNLVFFFLLLSFSILCLSVPVFLPVFVFSSSLSLLQRSLFVSSSPCSSSDAFQTFRTVVSLRFLSIVPDLGVVTDTRTGRVSERVLTSVRGLSLEDWIQLFPLVRFIADYCHTSSSSSGSVVYGQGGIHWKFWFRNRLLHKRPLPVLLEIENCNKCSGDSAFTVFSFLRI